MKEIVFIRHFDIADYLQIWKSMQFFTDHRSEETPDELCIDQHFPVFTLGQQGKQEHILDANHQIPVIQTDRGGQVTYHAPGQILLYPLINCRRKKITVRPLVTLLEQTMIAVLQDFAIASYARSNAPGVYVNNAK